MYKNYTVKTTEIAERYYRKSLKTWRWNMIADWRVDIIKISILTVCNAAVIPIKILGRTL